MRSWGAADRTISDRMTTIRVGLRQWGDPADVTTEILARWLANVTFAQWTKVTYCYTLKSYFGWLSDTGRILSNPAAGLRTPKAPRDKPRPLTLAQVDTILTHSSGNLHAWLLIGLLSGLRAHEIAKLRGQDITEEEIFVLGKGRQEATIPTHRRLWELAQTYPRGGWLFPARKGTVSGHVAAQSVSTITTKYFRSVGIEGSIHRCRHTYATQLLPNGANVRVVQELMRHETLASTAKYTGVVADELSAAILSLEIGATARS
jgi:integrase/recombinase XerD